MQAGRKGGSYCCNVIHVTGMIAVRVRPVLHWIIRVLPGVRGVGPVTVPSGMAGTSHCWAAGKTGFIERIFEKIYQI